MSFTKIVALWIIIASLLFANGVASQLVFIPVFGLEAGEMMAAFIGIAIVFGVSRPFLLPERESSRGRALRISALWLVLTVLFEIGLGRTVQLTGPGIPVYGMWDGSFWAIIVLAMATAPVTWLRGPGLAATGVTK